MTPDPLVIPRRIRWHRGMGTLASISSNPLGARYCGRPSRAGNPHRILRVPNSWAVTGPAGERRFDTEREAAEWAVNRFRGDLHAGRLAVTITDLQRWCRGMDLACACHLDMPCHTVPLLIAVNPDLDPTLFAARPEPST
jgi:hypothetical protein